MISPAERLSQMQAHLQAMQVRVNRMGDRPSREEIQAMLSEIGASLSDSPPHLAPPFTGTDSTEAVDALYVAAGQVAVSAAGQRNDVDTVEHVRQNRLRSWQKPADR